MAEKPGSTPMFETIMPRSCSGTTSRTRASSFAMSFSVSSRRVPEGLFTRMTNWPASVERKEGETEQGSDQQAGGEDAGEHVRAVATGRATARLTDRS